jgi:uncharacterized membrane protein YbhN (UPF0104 family)
MRDVRSDVLAAPPRAASPARGRWKRPGASIASIAISGAVLFAVYRSMDVGLIGQALLRAEPAWLVVSIGMILPITVLRAIRFFWVAPAGALHGIGEALRLTLVASALNLFLPAKTGDLIKSYFVTKRGETSPGVAVAVIIYERLCDLFGLISWCLIGWLVGRPDVPGLPGAFWWLLASVGAVSGLLIVSERTAAASRVVVARLLPHRTLRPLRRVAEGWPDLLQLLQGRRRWIVPFSLVLWLGHLFQIWLFTITLSVPMPFTVCASLSAIALMAGQLPLTFAGLGTRDLALVVLFSRYMSAESAAALGVLIVTRNLLPPLFGMPFMRSYLSYFVTDARRWRLRTEQGQ